MIITRDNKRKHLIFDLETLLYTNSLNRASGLFLLLVRVSTGHTYFLDDEIREPMRPTTVFFSCSTPEKCSGKATRRVCREAPYTTGRKRNHLRAKANTLILARVVAMFLILARVVAMFLILARVVAMFLILARVVAMLNRQQNIPRCIPTLKSRACYNYATRLFQFVKALWCACFDGGRTHEKWPR